MTPRVRYFVSRVPEPETFHWFDLGLLPRDPVDLGIDVRLERLITHLPFPRCALVFVDADGRSTMLSLLEGTASVTVAGIVDIGGGQHAPIEPLAYVVSEDGIRVSSPAGVQNTHDRHEQSLAILAVLQGFLRALDTRGDTCWQPTAKGGFLNAKRAVKGKPPAAWIWRTVRIEASRDAEPGTPGRPSERHLRAHDRRGHWRRLGTDRLVWIRACRVGSTQVGVSEHDYLINTTKAFNYEH
jgi:hypothetical protein